MRFYYYPAVEHGYLSGFNGAMAEHGFIFEKGPNLTPGMIRRHKKEFDGVHFHWIEHVLSHRSRIYRALSLVNLWRSLPLLKSLDKKVIWTVHNHAPHEPDWAFEIGRDMVVKAAELVITYSPWSTNLVREELDVPCPIVEVWHGNFKGTHGPERTAAQAREYFGVDPDKFVVGILGNVRAYRGHDIAIEAMKHVPDDVQLLIAGGSEFPDQVEEVHQLAKNVPSVKFDFREPLSDIEYAEAILACDAVLLPYRDITSSGALLSAWTVGRPVITTRLSYFEEYLQYTTPASLILVDPRTPEGFAAAICEMREYPEERREQESLELSDRFKWSKCVEDAAQAMNAWR